MKGETQEPAALEKRAQPGRVRAVFLAAFVHLAFFALIVFGVTWQSSPTPPAQAELWDKLPPADKAKPEPAKPEPPKPDPAIAQKLEREKREKEKKEKLEKEKKDKAEKEKREKDDAAKKKREDDKRRVEEERQRKEAEKAAAQAREEAASARQKAIDTWVGRIRDKIRGRANVPDTVSGKPSVQVRIKILPGGEVLDISISKSSGNRVYDNAIERAIRSASPLPVPEANSELFPTFRDLTLNIEHER